MLIALLIAWIVLVVLMFAFLVWRLFNGSFYFAGREIRYPDRPILFWLLMGMFLPFTGCQAVGATMLLLRELGGG